MITVGKLISMLKFPPDFEFVYNDSDKDYDNMFPHFLDGMTQEFADIILECPYINLIDFRDGIIELEGKMIYDEVIARGILKNKISTDPIIDFDTLYRRFDSKYPDTRGDVTTDFNSTYPNILDSPE